MKTSSCTEKKYYAFNNARKCGAKTKRNNGKPCCSPAVRGKNRCRFHGGGANSGAQRGNINALKNGLFTATAKKYRKSVSQLIKDSRALAKLVD